MCNSNNYKERVKLPKTIALVFIGFIFFWLLTLLSLALSIGIFALIVFYKTYYLLLVALIPFFISYKCFRAIFVSPKVDPFYYQLTKKEALKLFLLVEDVRSALKASKISKIYITPEFNACVALYPRIGFWGTKKPVLMLGMQLLQVLNTEQLKSVIAHEMAHLSKKHPGFSYWIYRVRLTWQQAFTEFSKDQALSKLVIRFINWYMPLLLKYTFPLSRQNEYEADKLAASFVGNDAIVDALIYTAVRTKWLKDNYWKKVFYQQKQEPSPTINPSRPIFRRFGIAR